MERFFITTDWHGCYGELAELLDKVLDYDIYRDIRNRRYIFAGDYIDRGDNSLGCLMTAYYFSTMSDNIILCGNHENSFARWLKGNPVKIKNDRIEFISQWNNYEKNFPIDAKITKDWLINDLLNHKGYEVLDKGRLIVSHAGIKDCDIGKENKRVKAFCMYGDTTGEKDEFGYPIRKDWASTRKINKKSPLIVYGHCAHFNKPEFINNTINIDTACVYGNYLTGLLYPEREFIQVRAKKQYAIYKRGKLK